MDASDLLYFVCCHVCCCRCSRDTVLRTLRDTVMCDADALLVLLELTWMFPGSLLRYHVTFGCLDAL